MPVVDRPPAFGLAAAAFAPQGIFSGHRFAAAKPPPQMAQKIRIHFKDFFMKSGGEALDFAAARSSLIELCEPGSRTSNVAPLELSRNSDCGSQYSYRETGKY
jgi:hypothetical protein